MSELRDLVLEYDALVDEMAGYPVETEPPATAEELRAAERVLGCDLHPDQLVYRSIHRAGLYPVNAAVLSLPERRSDLVFVPGFEVAPFDARRTLQFFAQPMAFAPQEGPLAGRIIEMEAPDPTPVLLASGLVELFSSWIAYIRAGLLEWNPEFERFLWPEGCSPGSSNPLAVEYRQRVDESAGPGVRPAAIGMSFFEYDRDDAGSYEDWRVRTTSEAGFDLDVLLDGDVEGLEEAEAAFFAWQAADPNS